MYFDIENNISFSKLEEALKRKRKDEGKCENYRKMDEPPRRPNPSERKQSLVEPQAQQQPALHQSDADDDDENVKQLNECSSLYLSLQVIQSQPHNLIIYIY